MDFQRQKQDKEKETPKVTTSKGTRAANRKKAKGRDMVAKEGLEPPTRGL